MISKKAEILKKRLQLVKPMLKKAPLSVSRKGQDRIGALCEKALEGRTIHTELEFPTFIASMVEPTSISLARDDAVILYLHGGGYTAGGLEYARGFACVLCYTTRLRTFCVAYRLAPETPFPGALDDALTAYEYLLAQGYAPDKIILAGESAGGGLSLALVHKLKQLSRPIPAACLAISPWTDLTMTSPTVESNYDNDPSLNVEQLAQYAEMYAGTQLTDPLVSPLFGDFADFPPTLIFVGGDEILLHDSTELYAKMIAAGVKCEIVEEEGMWHVYVIYGLPESDTALDRIKDFFGEVLA